jgi:small subunit ribosomal protein S4
VLEANALAERDVPDISKSITPRVPPNSLAFRLSEVPYPTHMEPNLVIEFYSR